MSKFIPNSYQVPNHLVDELMSKLSGNEFKCLNLIIRKTRGWNKDSDCVSITQFTKFTGIKKKETLYNCLNNLQEKGLIKINKLLGKVNSYELSENFNYIEENQYQKTVVPKKGTGTSTDKRYSQNNKQNKTITKECPPDKKLFDQWYEKYPVHKQRKPAENIWKRKRLDNKFDELMSKLEQQKTSDSQWASGFIPHPTTYLNQERWDDEIQKSPSKDAVQTVKKTEADKKRYEDSKRYEESLNYAMSIVHKCFNENKPLPDDVDQSVKVTFSEMGWGDGGQLQEKININDLYYKSKKMQTFKRILYDNYHSTRISGSNHASFSAKKQSQELTNIVSNLANSMLVVKNLNNKLII